MCAEESHRKPPLLSRYGARNSVSATSISLEASSASRWPAPGPSGVGSRVEVELMTISFHKTYDVSRACSLDQHDERLSCFDDIRGELRHVGGAYILHRVDRLSRDEKDLARVARRRLALELILQ